MSDNYDDTSVFHPYQADAGTENDRATVGPVAQPRRTPTRRENDFYPTPVALADEICERLTEFLPDVHAEVIEPSAGGGAFLGPLRRIWADFRVTAIDITAEPDDLIQKGATVAFRSDWEAWVSQAQFSGKVLVVGNPPFRLAERHIIAALNHLPVGSHVCFLLKLGFLCGKKRAARLCGNRQLRYLVPIVGRPSFVKGAKATTDNQEYSLFVWEVGYQGNAEVLFPHLVWKK